MQEIEHKCEALRAHASQRDAEAEQSKKLLMRAAEEKTALLEMVRKLQETLAGDGPATGGDGGERGRELGVALKQKDELIEELQNLEKV
jgi:hypothetical protein